MEARGSRAVQHLAQFKMNLPCVSLPQLQFNGYEGAALPDYCKKTTSDLEGDAGGQRKICLVRPGPSTRLVVGSPPITREWRLRSQLRCRPSMSIASLLWRYDETERFAVMLTISSRARRH